ncbi:hypothetical protein M3175_18835 [Robertmurraya korlensis]|uniref:hypothetical protein n=1 Tax=Robertmurraya korlensis TaxID=519977 RepID=UPI00203B714B|nr:hypothetical protein [Robertmurraya korlensis]MCM3602795.1 hypothetical protein [Robertmurraya korlensis]
MNNQVTEEQSLVGSNNGEWKESWFVIGQDDIVGDPIFIETIGKEQLMSYIKNRKYIYRK